MKSNIVRGPIPQELSTPRSSVSRPTSPSRGPLPPPELGPGPGHTDTKPRLRLRPPQRTIPNRATSFPHSGDVSAPGARAESSRHNEAQKAARPGSRAEGLRLLNAAEQVPRLTGFQELVRNQTDKVFQQMSPAEQKQAQERAEKWKKKQAAAPHQESEIQPADPAAAVQAFSPAGQPLSREPVSMLVQRHGMLIERQAQVAQMLEEAKAQLAPAQDLLSARAPVHAPDAPAQTPTAPTSPRTSASDSPFFSAQSFIAYHTPEGSIASDAEADPAGRPVHVQQESLARLQHQARELGRQVQVLNDRLEAVRQQRIEVDNQLGGATVQFRLSESQITEALRQNGFGRQAHLDKENGSVYLEMVALEQRAKQLERLEETLTALLGPAQRDLGKIEQQLAEANRRTSNGASPRAPVPTPSARSQSAGTDPLQEALPDGGVAVARLAERAARRSPRTLAGWLQRPSFKGPPKPLEGRRQDAFMQLVRTDVMKVAQHGNILPEQAAALMFDAVDREALGAPLSQADKAHLLDTLDKLGKELATAQPQVRQP